ncbi:MATE family efflux transporter [Oceanimonas sp. CHS3-5]|uniref:MATE family efflux transporter n=1 Tax=Oceanimonas sp. CHS3-5 TaxID=3068186 RepID=UPI00273D358E|nr:MATE family efflux transporter [Oceanimonas sp. CHS3-5]MDP5291222.1 MATE family efflux transporter [Oceanimonas sp. CHS3-5]
MTDADVMKPTGESLGQQLYRMTWPMLIGVLAIMSSQMVDSAFIGQLGTQPLAAVGFTIPVYQLIIGIQVGLGIATTTIISTALGAGRRGEARQLGSLVLATGGGSGVAALPAGLGRAASDCLPSGGHRVAVSAGTGILAALAG